MLIKVFASDTQHAPQLTLGRLTYTILIHINRLVLPHTHTSRDERDIYFESGFKLIPTNEADNSVCFIFLIRSFLLWWQKLALAKTILDEVLHVTTPWSPISSPTPSPHVHTPISLNRQFTWRRYGYRSYFSAPHPSGSQIHELVVVSAPPPRRDVTYAVRHSVPLDGVLISRNAPYAADCGRCLKGVMFARAHSFACRLRISTLVWKSANQRSEGETPMRFFTIVACRSPIGSRCRLNHALLALSVVGIWVEQSSLRE